MALLAVAPGCPAPMLATLFGIYAVTRILNPAEYGNYALVTTILLFRRNALLAWIDLGACCG
jgi:hypothetical protein